MVGVAASHDEFGACYNMQYRLQKSTLEMIEDMESIMTHHLEIYKKYRKCLPSHIIYYRDGVSDGQFPTIKKEEVNKIISACKRMVIKQNLLWLFMIYFVISLDYYIQLLYLLSLFIYLFFSLRNVMQK